jgi:hypothetical protein
VKAFTSGNPGGAAAAVGDPTGLLIAPKAAATAALMMNGFDDLDDIGGPPLVLNAECTS